MNILFTTKYPDTPSTQLNIGNLQRLNHLEGVHIDFYHTDYAAYDVVLFMGYDPDIQIARAKNPHLKIGVIDPRPQFDQQPVGADFILANGIEMKDWYLTYTPHIFLYYICPQLQRQQKHHRASKRILLGYHGNKDHLQEMYPRITQALDRLANEYQVELWAMYNIEQLGKWDCPPSFRSGKIGVKHIQWTEENYDASLSRVDIGIVPNLTPINDDIKRILLPQPEKPTGFARVQRKFLHKVFPPELSPHYREHETDYLLRYKATSNPGRIFVFAQYGIPVVADMFPSALQVIEDGVNGFVCYSTEAWYWSLKTLADNPALRTEFAQEMTKTFDKIAAPDVLNKKLVHFIRDI